jgi:hypothetical protein
MNKTITNGICSIKNDRNVKFSNQGAAIMAAQHMQLAMAYQGNLTYCHIDPSNHYASVSVHFDITSSVHEPATAQYSTRETMSHAYWSEYEKKMIRVRVREYRYRF